MTSGSSTSLGLSTYHLLLLQTGCHNLGPEQAGFIIIHRVRKQHLRLETCAKKAIGTNEGWKAILQAKSCIYSITAYKPHELMSSANRPELTPTCFSRRFQCKRASWLPRRSSPPTQLQLSPSYSTPASTPQSPPPSPWFTPSHYPPPPIFPSRPSLPPAPTLLSPKQPPPPAMLSDKLSKHTSVYPAVRSKTPTCRLSSPP